MISTTKLLPWEQNMLLVMTLPEGQIIESYIKGNHQDYNAVVRAGEFISRAIPLLSREHQTRVSTLYSKLMGQCNEIHAKISGATR